MQVPVNFWHRHCCSGSSVQPSCPVLLLVHFWEHRQEFVLIIEALMSNCVARCACSGIHCQLGAENEDQNLILSLCKTVEV